MAKIFVRKNITYRASTAILCKAGAELGVTCHGHHDFQLSDDVLHKVHIGHYTFYSKAIVKHPKLMIRAPGVFAREYIGGESLADVKLLKQDTSAPEKLPKTYSDVMYGGTLYDGTSDPDKSEQLPEGTLYSSTQSYFADNAALRNNYYIRGTCYGATKSGGNREVTYKHLCSLGFGESTYPGCRYAREGHGMCLAGAQRTLESMI